MKISHILPVLVLALLFTAAALAQSKPDAPAAAKTDVSKPAVNPLALTDAEKAEGIPLQADLNEKERGLKVRLDAVLVGDSAVILVAAQEARIYYGEQVIPARNKFTDWLKRAQERAQCAGCALGKDAVFVRPEPK